MNSVSAWCLWISWCSINMLFVNCNQLDAHSSRLEREQGPWGTHLPRPPYGTAVFIFIDTCWDSMKRQVSVALYFKLTAPILRYVIALFVLTALVGAHQFRTQSITVQRICIASLVSWRTCRAAFNTLEPAALANTNFLRQNLGSVIIYCSSTRNSKLQ